VGGGGDAGDVAVLEVDDVAGVGEHGGDVGGDEVLGAGAVFADADAAEAEQSGELWRAATIVAGSPSWTTASAQVPWS
jgi:hypothetical protein